MIEGTPQAPLRIAYVLRYDLFEETGVTKKIATQVAAWRASGRADVAVFALVREKAARPGRPPVVPASLFPYPRSIWGRWRAVRALTRSVLEWGPDLLYFRLCLYQPGLRRLLRRFPTVVEVNADDAAELRRRGGPKHWYNLLTRGRLLGSAAGFVPVTPELASLTGCTSYRKLVQVISNGYDLSGVRPTPPPDHPRPRLILVGTAPWWRQGVDKFLEMARALPEFDFQLVGIEAEQLGHEVPSNFHALGYRVGEEYERALENADIGVGTLALHRQGIQEGSTLKVREYLAFGLPVILAGTDVDLSDGDEFVLHLPNTEDCVAPEIDRIRDFVWRMKGRRVPGKWAAARIGAREKERQRLDFLARVAGRALSRSPKRRVSH